MKIISNVTKGLIGKLCWGVEWERQLNLSMSFGNPRLRIREPYVSNARSLRVRENASSRRVTVKGEWWLWIGCAYWKIVIPNSLTATSSSPFRVKRTAMAHLSGQRLVEIWVNEKHGASEFTFDLGGILDVRRMEKDHDDPLWTLYKPNGYVLEVNGNGTFTYARGKTPIKELTPMKLK